MTRRTALRARPWAIVAVLLVSGAGRLAAQSERPELSVRLPSYGGVVRLDTLATFNNVPFPAAVVWQRVHDAFAGWGVPLTMNDSAGGRLGVVDAVRTRFGRLWMSQVFDCGTDMTGQVADHSRVRLSVVAFLWPRGADSTRVGVAALAVARPNDGSFHEDIVCRSTSWIENQLWAAAAGRPTGDR